MTNDKTFTVLDTGAIRERLETAKKKIQESDKDLALAFEHITNLLNVSTGIAIGEPVNITSRSTILASVDLTTLVLYLMDNPVNPVVLAHPKTGQELHLRLRNLDVMNEACREAFTRAYSDQPELVHNMPDSFKVGLIIQPADKGGVVNEGVMLVTGGIAEHYNRFAVTYISDDAEVFGGVTQVDFPTHELHNTIKLMDARKDLVGGLEKDVFDKLRKREASTFDTPDHNLRALPSEPPSIDMVTTGRPKTTKINVPPFPNAPTPSECHRVSDGSLDWDF